AAPRPIGIAIIAAMTTIFIVPIISAQIPHSPSPTYGCHVVEVRKSVIGTLEKNSKDCEINVYRIPMVATTDTKVINNSIIGIILSNIFDLFLVFLTICSRILLLLMINLSLL